MVIDFLTYLLRYSSYVHSSPVGKLVGGGGGGGGEGRGMCQCV